MLLFLIRDYCILILGVSAAQRAEQGENRISGFEDKAEELKHSDKENERYEEATNGASKAPGT